MIVRGALNGYRVRVVYADGRLYMVKSATNIVSLASEEPVQHQSDLWQFSTANGNVTVVARGCGSCGYRLGRLKVEDIVVSG